MSAFAAMPVEKGMTNTRPAAVIQPSEQAGGAASAFDLVVAGRPTACIVIGDQRDPLVLDAATCLNFYIGKITGTQLVVRTETEAGAGAGVSNRVVLGATVAAARAGLDTAGLESDGYRLKVSGRTLFILGPDRSFRAVEPVFDATATNGTTAADEAPADEDEDIATHDGQRIERLERIKAMRVTRQVRWKARWTGICAVRGTLNGVIRVLHDYGGVRWFLPSPQGERIPTASAFRVPGDLNIVEKPAFQAAFANADGLWAYTPSNYWAMGNGFRVPLNLRYFFGHSWGSQIGLAAGSPGALFRQHPEYFAMRQGRREYKPKGSVLCTSNPAVVDLLTRTMQRWFDAGWDWVQYNQSDGYKRCECEACDALDGYRLYERGAFTNPCERLLGPAYEMAQRCLKSHPDKHILMLSYGPTRLPSRQFDRFPSNVVLQMCHTTTNDFARWAGKADAYAVWLYWFGAYQTPGIAVKYTPRAAAERLQYFHQQGVRLLYWGCGKGGINWGNEGPVYYVVGQLIRNPRLDYQRVLDEYYEGVFEAAAPAMRRYFDLLYRQVQTNHVDRARDETGGAHVYTIRTYFTNTYPNAILSQLENFLDDAQARADTDRARHWVALTRDQFTYLQTTAQVFLEYDRLMGEPTLDNARRLQAARAARDSYLARLRGYKRDPEFIRDWYPGYQTIVPHAADGNGKKDRNLTRYPPFFWKEETPEGLLKKALKAQKRATPARDRPKEDNLES